MNYYSIMCGIIKDKIMISVEVLFEILMEVFVSCWCSVRMFCSRIKIVKIDYKFQDPSWLFFSQPKVWCRNAKTYHYPHYAAWHNKFCNKLCIICLTKQAAKYASVQSVAFFQIEKFCREIKRSSSYYLLIRFLEFFTVIA